MNKHQHDIFFRYNKAKNELAEKKANGTLTKVEETNYHKCIAQLESLLKYGSGIVWLTSAEYGVALGTVAWAGMERGK